jgi:actin-related protein
MSPVVLDIGTLESKCGFADDLLPRALFPTVVGHPKYNPPANTIGMGKKDCYVGDEALSKCGIMVIEYPIHRGLIADWEYMEKLWHHIFTTKSDAPEDQPVLLLEPPNNTKDTREKTTQIMFEQFSVPALCFTNPAVPQSGRNRWSCWIWAVTI